MQNLMIMASYNFSIYVCDCHLCLCSYLFNVVEVLLCQNEILQTSCILFLGTLGDRFTSKQVFISAWNVVIFE